MRLVAIEKGHVTRVGFTQNTIAGQSYAANDEPSSLTHGGSRQGHARCSGKTYPHPQSWQVKRTRAKKGAALWHHKLAVPPSRACV